MARKESGHNSAVLRDLETPVGRSRAHSNLGYSQSRRSDHTNPFLFRQLSQAALILFSLLAYVTVLEYTYREIVAPRFGYLGYLNREPDKLWLTFGFVVAAMLALFLPRNITRASDIVVWVLYVVVFVPLAQIPHYGSALEPTEVFKYSVFAALIILIMTKVTQRDVFRRLVPVLSGKGKLFWAIIIVITAATYSLSFALFGFKFEIMSVFDVASTRLEYRDEVAPSVPLLGYLVSNQGNIVNPLLISLGVSKRRWTLIAAGVFGQLLLYSVTGYRTALLSIVICLLASLFLQKRAALWGGAILLGTAFLAWAAVAIDRVFSVGAVELIVNRMLITAGYLTPHYLQVYADENWHYWAYSFLGWLMDDPREVSPGFYVSTVAFNRPDIQSNANLFADGYANLGYWGVAIEAAILGAILLLTNSASRGLPIRVVLPTLILPAFALANGSPITAFLSFGFALAIIMFALMPRDAPTTTKNIYKATNKNGTIGNSPVRKVTKEAT